VDSAPSRRQIAAQMTVSHQGQSSSTYCFSCGRPVATPSRFLSGTPRLSFRRGGAGSWPANTQLPGRNRLMGPSRNALRPPAPLAKVPACVPSPWPPVGFRSQLRRPRRRPQPRLPQKTARPQRKHPRELEIGYAPIAGRPAALFTQGKASRPSARSRRPGGLTAQGRRRRLTEPAFRHR